MVRLITTVAVACGWSSGTHGRTVGDAVHMKNFPWSCIMLDGWRRIIR